MFYSASKWIYESLMFFFSQTLQETYQSYTESEYKSKVTVLSRIGQFIERNLASEKRPSLKKRLKMLKKR